MLLLLTWLLLSVPVSLVLVRAMARGAEVPHTRPQPVADWRREPAAA